MYHPDRVVLLHHLEHHLRTVRTETDGLAAETGPAAVALADLRRHLAEADELLADLLALLAAPARLQDGCRSA